MSEIPFQIAEAAGWLIGLYIVYKTFKWITKPKNRETQDAATENQK